MCRPSYICEKCKDNSLKKRKINIAKKALHAFATNASAALLAFTT